VQAWDDGARSTADVATRTRATTGCGGCTDAVGGILQWLRAADPDPGHPAPDPAGAARGAPPPADPNAPSPASHEAPLAPNPGGPR
jgi:hypothetical protein